MSLPVNWPHSIAQAVGVADTVATVVPGIKAADNLLAVIAEEDGVIDTQDTTDFTVAAGTITAGTLDLTGKVLTVIWTSASPTS